MSLHFIREIHPHIILGVWNITESPEELLENCTFSEKEKFRLNDFKIENKKLQWLSARVLLRKMMGSNSAEVVYSEAGKPLLNDPAVHVSFSHTGRFVAVIINNKEETGIDIEKITHKVNGIKYKFLSDKELFDIPRDDFEKLTVYWGAKEALYKLYGKKGLIYKEDLVIQPFELSGNGVFHGAIKKADFQKKYLLKFEKMEEHILVYVLEEVFLQPEI